MRPWLNWIPACRQAGSTCPKGRFAAYGADANHTEELKEQRLTKSAVTK